MSSAVSSEQIRDGSIDAGLLVLAALSPATQNWSHRDIAFVCGCSRSLIWQLEKSAIRKLRRRLGQREEVKEFLATR